MRSEPIIRVTCDREPDCLEAIEIPLEVELAEQDAFVAEKLEESGWQVGEDGQDVCPTCARRIETLEDVVAALAAEAPADNSAYIGRHRASPASTDLDPLTPQRNFGLGGRW